jgi:integrase
MPGTAAAALKAGKPMPELVFPSTTWTALDPSHIQRDFHFVLKKAEMRRIPFHDTRHPFASLLLRKGESPVYVPHQLGHHDISMTVGTCGHLIPGDNRQAVNRLADADWRGKKVTGKAVQTRTGNRLATGQEKGVRLVSLTP